MSRRHVVEEEQKKKGHEPNATVIESLFTEKRYL